MLVYEPLVSMPMGSIMILTVVSVINSKEQRVNFINLGNQPDDLDHQVLAVGYGVLVFFYPKLTTKSFTFFLIIEQ